VKNTDYNVALNHLRVLLVRASAVKTYRGLLLPGLILSLIAIAQPTTTRADVTVDIFNLTKAPVKVCVYKAYDKVMVVALKCWTLAAGESVTWTREDVFLFNVLVYRPGVLDKVICEAKDLHGTRGFFGSNGAIYIAAPCQILTSDPRSEPTPWPKTAPTPTPKPAPKPAKKYTLRVCNTTGATVQFALGYIIDPSNYVGEGWWLVSKDSCMNIDMSEVWKPQGLKDGSFAPTFMYAKSGRFFQQIWEGRVQDYDPSFCINQKKAFAIRQFEIKDNKRYAVACKGTNLEVVHFFEIPNPEFNESYSWTFK